MAKYLDYTGLVELVEKLKKYTDEAVSAFDLFIVVTSLPTSDIQTNRIYLVPDANAEEGNAYDEYAYVDGKWEMLGSVTLDTDLSNYYTKEEVDGLINQVQASEDTAPWYMDIDTRGDSFLAYGETLTATCYVYHGWNLVTDKVEKWTITRDSGDEASDAVWNASDKAKAFAGEIEIGYDDLSLVQLTTYFTATAEGSEIEPTSYTVRFG